MVDYHRCFGLFYWHSAWSIERGLGEGWVNERKRNRIIKRVAKNKAKLSKFIASDSQGSYTFIELAKRSISSFEGSELYGRTPIGSCKEMYQALNNWCSAQTTKQPTKKAPAPKGRIPWYDQAIKKCYSWIEKICKNQGYYGEDKYRQVEAPVPDEIKDYLEDEEIDFKLREKDDIPK